MWSSKIIRYEKPYIVKGNVNFQAHRMAPKDICKDKTNGTGKT